MAAVTGVEPVHVLPCLSFPSWPVTVPANRQCSDIDAYEEIKLHLDRPRRLRKAALWVAASLHPLRPNLSAYLLWMFAPCVLTTGNYN